MKNIVILLVSLLLFASCGKHIKNLTKSKTIDRSEKSHVDSASTKFTDTSSKKVIDTSKTKLVDTSSKITHEKLDTVFKSPEVNLNDSLNINDDTTTGDIIEKKTEKDGIELTTKYNKKTKQFTTDVKKKAEEHRAFIDKTTIEKKGVTLEQNKNVTTEDKKGIGFEQKNFNADHEKKDIINKGKDVHKEHNYSINTIVFGIVIIVIVVIVIWWFFGRPKKVKEEKS